MALKIIIIGGGAAGFFAAIAAREANPLAEVSILEKSAQLLSKVRISGGGRCNVTHACFDPRELSKNYPRGQRELIGSFHRFGPHDTIEWFRERGVALHVEEDGRMFPTSNSSEEIIRCLTEEAKRLGVVVRTLTRVEKIKEHFVLETAKESLACDRLLLATGSSKEGYAWAEDFGHTIEEPIPSLFTFNIPDFSLKDLAGITVSEAELSIAGTRLSQRGPLLLTHWGFSGPAALKLSAWGARYLHEKQYKVELLVNWTGNRSCEEVRAFLLGCKKNSPAQRPAPLFEIPKNLWLRLLEHAGLRSSERFSEIKDALLEKLAEILTRDSYFADGKTTHKAEFVTCGGVTLSEVDLKTMQSKRCPGLYFAGEILDIDGITGGFNFQNAWTTGYLAGSAIAQ